MDLVQWLERQLDQVWDLILGCTLDEVEEPAVRVLVGEANAYRRTLAHISGITGSEVLDGVFDRMRVGRQAQSTEQIPA